MKLKTILVSQPQPLDIEKSPYGELAKTYNLTVDFHKFIHIEGVSSREFRKDRVSLADYSAIIMTGRNSVDHYFRLAQELRFEVPESMKYFCLAESTAYYLQKYVQYRKRKIFFGKQGLDDLIDVMRKHKDEKFLLPCSDIHRDSMADVLDQNNISYTKAVMYKTVASNLKSIKIDEYDMIVFFSPAGIKSLQKNFPKYKQGDTFFAGFGESTCEAVRQAGFQLHIEAPTKTSPSMTMAIEEFIESEIKKSRKR
ncbi:MAG: uroporphyrinogen-III synthase [Bacteroidales bacterium]|jgi:uroporphyrinogen-III synthase|nr:uroporphyrinogen-III synthase [Bacteroidales bacterium]MDD3701947.1 uroporphyrinogen-III synthase [Bacteroidales bacterium]MDY0369178.1 uroporphyrinogen-III synthase [Bacteroidales bacterium]